MSTVLTDIPGEMGHYALYDGLNMMSAGVTFNMRQSLQDSIGRHQRPLRAIYHWKPDNDGSAGLWLNGKIRCSRCDAIVKIFDKQIHDRDIHDIDPPCECD